MCTFVTRRPSAWRVAILTTDSAIESSCKHPLLTAHRGCLPDPSSIVAHNHRGNNHEMSLREIESKSVCGARRVNETDRALHNGRLSLQRGCPRGPGVARGRLHRVRRGIG